MLIYREEQAAAICKNEVLLLTVSSTYIGNGSVEILILKLSCMNFGIKHMISSMIFYRSVFWRTRMLAVGKENRKIEAEMYKHCSFEFKLKAWIWIHDYFCFKIHLYTYIFLLFIYWKGWKRMTSLAAMRTLTVISKFHSDFMERDFLGEMVDFRSGVENVYDESEGRCCTWKQGNYEKLLGSCSKEPGANFKRLSLTKDGKKIERKNILTAMTKAYQIHWNSWVVSDTK